MIYFYAYTLDSRVRCIDICCLLYSVCMDLITVLAPSLEGDLDRVKRSWSRDRGKTT